MIRIPGCRHRCRHRLLRSSNFQSAHPFPLASRWHRRRAQQCRMSDPNWDAIWVRPFSAVVGSRRSCYLHRNVDDRYDIVCTPALAASSPHSRYCTLGAISWNASHLKIEAKETRIFNWQLSSEPIVGLNSSRCCTFNGMWKQMIRNIFACFQSAIRTSNDTTRHSSLGTTKIALDTRELDETGQLCGKWCDFASTIDFELSET